MKCLYYEERRQPCGITRGACIVKGKIDAVHNLLTRYSKYLQDCGYLDDDWWSEEPNAVDRFIQEEKNG